MTVEIGNGNYISGMWFFGSSGNEEFDLGPMDYMMTLWRPKGYDHFVADYRFRYHTDAPNVSVFESKDRKSWYRIEFGKDHSEESLAFDMHMLVQQLATHIGARAEFVSIRSDKYEDFRAAVKDKRWIHIKEEKKKEVNP